MLHSQFSDCTVQFHSTLQVTREVFEASKGRLRVVGRAGVGIDNVDLTAASEVRTAALSGVCGMGGLGYVTRIPLPAMGGMGLLRGDPATRISYSNSSN